jgi:hypothetical protein
MRANAPVLTLTIDSTGVDEFVVYALESTTRWVESIQPSGFVFEVTGRVPIPPDGVTRKMPGPPPQPPCELLMMLVAITPVGDSGPINEQTPLVASGFRANGSGRLRPSHDVTEPV